MRVIVCGSRKWWNRDSIIERFADLPCDEQVTIVHGAAAGADKIAHQEAQKFGFLVEPHPANWETYGKGAGFMRNREMIALGADLCIAFWDRSSAGTAHTIGLAEKAGIPVEIITEKV